MSPVWLKQRLIFSVSLDTTGFVNPQFSVSAVEPSASQVVGSFPFVIERVQKNTVEQIVHVPTLPIQEQVEESVQVEEQIVDIPDPPIVEEIVDVVQITPQEHFRQCTVPQIVEEISEVI